MGKKVLTRFCAATPFAVPVVLFAGAVELDLPPATGR